MANHPEQSSLWVHPQLLVKRVYEVDPLVCPRCAGTMRLIAFIDQPAVFEKILCHLAPWLAPAHNPPVQILAV